MKIKLQVWRDGWVSLNSKGHWEDVDESKLPEDMLRYAAHLPIPPEGPATFWHDKGTYHTKPFASASAKLYRVVVDAQA